MPSFKATIVTCCIIPKLLSWDLKSTGILLTALKDLNFLIGSKVSNMYREKSICKIFFDYSRSDSEGIHQHCWVISQHYFFLLWVSCEALGWRVFNLYLVNSIPSSKLIKEKCPIPLQSILQSRRVWPCFPQIFQLGSCFATH